MKNIVFVILILATIYKGNAQLNVYSELMTKNFVLPKIDTSYKLNLANNSYKNDTKSSTISIQAVPQTFEESITEIVEKGLPFAGKIWDHQLLEDGNQLYYIFKATPDKPEDYLTFLLYKKLVTGTVSVKADFPNYFSIEEMNELIETLKSVKAVE